MRPWGPEGICIRGKLDLQKNDRRCNVDTVRVLNLDFFELKINHLETGSMFFRCIQYGAGS